jgi:hypothetical protein
MTKKTQRKMKGGDISSWWSNNVSNSSWLNRSKSYLPNWFSSSSQTNNGVNYDYPVSTSPSNSASYGSTVSTNPSTGLNYGGRKKNKNKRGGFKANTPTTGLAFSASPVSGLATARVHNWVGGKTKKRRHKHSKSCKHSK